MEKTCQAVILAGGFGARLMPITHKCPKPLCKILDKSVLEIMCEKAMKIAGDNVYVTTMYLSDVVEKKIRKMKNADKIKILKERQPLGTAGSVKAAYDGKSDNILVIPGGAIFDFDLEKVMMRHIQTGADVTMVTYNCAEPLDFGVVETDKFGRVLKIYEKPSWSEVVSSKINTGIYAIKKHVLDFIPHNTNFDFSKELFPYLLEQNKKIMSVRLDGYWNDLATANDYFQCNVDALCGKIKGISNDGFSVSRLCDMGVDAEEPVFVSKSAKLGKSVKLGKYSIINDNAHIGDNCTVNAGIVLDKCSIGKGSDIELSIVGNRANIGENCVVPEGCVIGDCADIGEGVMLKKHTRILSGQKVSEGKDMLVDFKNKNKCVFGDTGIISTSTNLGGEFFTRLGYAVSKVCLENNKNGPSRVGVMSDPDVKSKLYKELILASAKSTGVYTCDFGEGSELLSRYAGKNFNCDVTVFVCSMNENSVIKLFDKSAHYIDTDFEKSLERYLAKDFDLEENKTFFETQKIYDLPEHYYAHIVKEAKKLLCDNTFGSLDVYIDDNDSAQGNFANNLLKRAVFELCGNVTGDATKADAQIFVSPDGTNSYIKTNSSQCDFNHMCAIILDFLCKNGVEKISLGTSLPETFRNIALSYNTKISDSSDFEPDFLYDGTLASLLILCVMKITGQNLEGLVEKIPEFDLCIDVFAGCKNRAGVMEKLSKLDKGKNSDGSLKIVMADGNVTVVPGRYAGFKIISESHSFEAAKELCTKIEDIIREQ